MAAHGQAFAPLDGDGRIAVLDALRGFALLGIFLVNVEWFSRPWQEFGTGIPAGLTGIDHAVAWCVHVLLAGKFWILFSLLFGIGFAVLMQRAEAAGRPFKALYLRRLAVLLAFGIAHALLLWTGDILHSYAIAGWLLFAARHARPRVQLAVGISIQAAIGLLALLGALAMSALPVPNDPEGREAAEATVAEAARAAEVYANGDFARITAQRVSDFSRFVVHDLGTVPMAFGIFLVGSWLARTGRIVDIAVHRGFWWKVAAIGLPVGLALTLGAAAVGTRFPVGTEEGRSVLASALSMLGALPLSLGYLAVVVLAWRSSAGRRILSAFAPAGRMALTNYLMQSLVCTLVFYGYGLALWGRLGYAQMILFAGVLFAVQVLASGWWLSRFRHGPMEWLWRWATYGQRPAMRA